MTVKIREAAKVDFENIVKLIAMFPNELIQTHLPEYQDFFVAEVAGNLVGCCAVEIFSKNGELRPRLAEIRSLAVCPQYWHQGIGRQLIESCIARAEQSNVYEVFAITPAPELFERLDMSTFNGAKFAVFRVLSKGA